ncbi:MAG: hypothetical protein JXJ19_02425 [Elusimicrobia bacterium]|nr:hypothetical protein [Elusimicrobiota bacterium]
MRYIKIFLFPALMTGFFYFNTGTARAEDTVKVYFNTPRASVSADKSDISSENKGIDDALVDFIGTAESGDKLYLCFYDLDRPNVIEAVNDAISEVGDGNIFMICESTDSSGIYDCISDLDITNVITDGTDDSPLMHNKFAVVINRKKDTGRVWAGSYNPTYNGTFVNNNNAVWIESYRLADVYADEFEYMYNGGAGKFSTHKSTSPNTAETVEVGGSDIDVYFAPYPDKAATNTSMVLEDLFDEATDSIYFCMFTFSSSETRLIEALVDAHDRGIDVRGVVEATQSSDVQSELREEGLDVSLDSNDGVLHHKFCVIDYGTSHQKVITGSYNWTLAAQNTNDENFLVIRSKDAVERFWKEFQRNKEAAGRFYEETDAPAVSDVLVYPSPAKNADEVTIGFTLSMSVTEVVIKAYTLSGDRVMKTEPEFYPGTYNERRWDLKNSNGSELAPGLYIVKVEGKTGDGSFFDTEKFVIIK